jgi:hypothetical protein
MKTSLREQFEANTGLRPANCQQGGPTHFHSVGGASEKVGRRTLVVGPTSPERGDRLSGAVRTRKRPLL